MSRRVLLHLFFGAALAGAAQARIVIYVDAQAGQTPHDGSDWCHAYARVSDALAIAGPDTLIRVADGTYLPDTVGLADPRTATFQLVSGIVLEGGYAGCNDGGDIRDPALYETTLSGDIPGSNCYHVVTGSGTDATAVLDGFTITAGQAEGSGAPNQGGGLFVAAGSPTVVRCVFRGNTAQYGGAVFNDSSAPRLTRCVFDTNVATASGGAVYNFGYPPEPAATLTDCVFLNNSAESSGGAMRNWDVSPTLQDCRFEANHARYGGAGAANGGQSHPSFARCVFDFNRTDTLFGTWDCYGGALHNTDTSHPLLVSCVFVSNSAYSLYPGLSRGGALANSGSAAPTLINCTLSANYANIGDGLHNSGQSTPTVRSSVLWNGGSEIVNADTAVASVTYSAVQGSWPGVGNTGADPLLANLRLQAGSPGINAGDPAYLPLTETDADGHARVLCGRVDMGVYEFGIGDVNCDQVVSLADFVAWPDCATGPDAGPYATGCEALDFEFDGDVDLADFAVLEWLLGE